MSPGEETPTTKKGPSQNFTTSPYIIVTRIKFLKISENVKKTISC